MGLNYGLRYKSENLLRKNPSEKFKKDNRNIFAENARFVEYYVRILALKIGENLTWYGTLCTTSDKSLIKLEIIPSTVFIVL